jgi:hypothetical protein
MKGEGHVTVGAASHVPTIATEHKGGCPPPVEKEDGLFVCGQRLAQRLLECPAEDATVPGAEFLTEIHDANRG